MYSTPSGKCFRRGSLSAAEGASMDCGAPNAGLGCRGGCMGCGACEGGSKGGGICCDICAGDNMGGGIGCGTIGGIGACAGRNDVP